MKILPLGKRSAAGLFALLFCLLNITEQASAQKIFALSGNNLVSFDATSPSAVTMVGSVTGLTAGQVLSGIDFRPQTGELYGIGYNSATGEARLYTLNLTTAAATAIGTAAVTVATNMGNIAFDFNPTVDRIRFMGSNNANYRLHPVTGAIAATDGTLAFATTDVNATADPEIGAGAYTNSYIASTGTTLINFDTKLNIFTTQNPPNNGTQNTLGASGIAVNQADPSVGLDIYFDPILGKNQLYLVANTGTSVNDDLYSVDNTTGAATLIGSVGMPLRDIAVQITRSVPPLAGDLIYALTSNNWLVSFDATNPGIIRSSVAISGVAMGQVLVGMDFRPATGELFALGYIAATGESRLYTLKTNTAVATAVGAATFNLATNLGKIGFDFNPVVDRIRVTSSSNANYRLNPNTGGIAATDLNLNFNAADVNAGKNPSVGASAYLNSFAGTTATTLFNYDDSLNVLLTQAPPNDGKLTTVGSSGITVNLADPTSDLDIFYDKTAAVNRAYLVANVGTSNFDNLYSLNTTSGAATLVGRIGYGSALVDVAAFNQPRVALFCPADITVSAPKNSGGMVVNYTPPTAASGCNDGLTTGTPTQVSGLASGDKFSGGVNAVCFSATDKCGNSNSCCFNVTVNETPCDTKVDGCVTFDVLSYLPDATGALVLRVRVKNGCTSPLLYATFQVQNGTTAVSPADNATYTAPSGNKYTVRSPSYSPIIGIKFSTMVGTTGIANGQSDIFEYVLPKYTTFAYPKGVAKTADGNYFQVTLSPNKCTTQLLVGSDDEFVEPQTPTKLKLTDELSDWRVYPNPSTGAFLADLSPFAGNQVSLSIFGISGKLLAHREIAEAQNEPLDLTQFAADWANGIYFVELRAHDGQRFTSKWVLQR